MDNMILKSKKEEADVNYEEILKKVVVAYLEERKSYDHTKYKYSYDDIAIFVGISKYKVQKIAKEYSTRRK